MSYRILSKYQIDAKFSSALESGENVSYLKERLKVSRKLTSEGYNYAKKILGDVDAETLNGCLMECRKFLIRDQIGKNINQEDCSRMLAELDSYQRIVEEKKSSLGDQFMAEVGIMQVKLLKQAWQLIKESCQLADEARNKIRAIDENMSKMESLSGNIEKFIAAFNGDKYREEVKKKAILMEINGLYQSLRTDYIRTREDIYSLRLSIDGQIISLNLIERDLNQNSGFVAVTMGAQALRGVLRSKVNPIETTKRMLTGANQMSRNSNAVQGIAIVRQKLTELQTEIGKLEERLAKVKATVDKAKMFLRKHDVYYY